jgi:hypothetical protein
VAASTATGGGLRPRAHVDWEAWHSSYEDPDSELGRRLALVRAQLRGALDRARPGPVRLISVCSGQGHDVIGVLAEHPRRADVSARLVELDLQNVLIAQRAAGSVGLDAVEVLAADASLTDSYEGAAPADVILVCGVFGNISMADIDNTIEHLSELCAPQATVIWTRHRHPPDLVPHIRAAFARSGFGELAFEDAAPFAVGADRLLGAPAPLTPGVKLFDFIGYRALWPHLGESERTALGALFRADSSLIELVEAVRALPYGQPSEDTVDGMLREGRGTSCAKHLFLAQLLARRFPETEPALVHRVYRLDRARALEMFGAEIAETVPSEGLIDVHRYLTIALAEGRVRLDATLSGAPWDGRSALAPACGPGSDFPAGADPDADMRALEGARCDPDARGPFLAALALAAAPPRAP